jgi:hypothetical protein
MSVYTSDLGLAFLLSSAISISIEKILFFLNINRDKLCGL